MTADNLTFSLEIDFIPDIQEGRMDLKAKMKEVAAKYSGTYVLDPKARPIISGLSKEDVENALKDLGLQAFGTWPSCILTCTINTPLPLRAVGMSDGWDIYTGKKTFFAFAQFPADALGRLLQIAHPGIIAQPLPQLEQHILRRRSQRLQIVQPGQGGILLPLAQRLAADADFFSQCLLAHPLRPARILDILPQCHTLALFPLFSDMILPQNMVKYQQVKLTKR